MRDVAERAGVSFKTVSRVVNREGGVSDDLLERVELAIASLGYQPDELARRLRRRDTLTGSIGFVVVDVSDPFLSSVLRGIEEVASASDSIVMAGSTDGDNDRENQLISAFVSRRVDGMIVVPEGSIRGALAIELERRAPVVFVDLELPRTTVDLVRSDHHGGAVAATEHLIARGHRDIAFFGDYPEISSSQFRRTGYVEALERAGIDIRENRIVQERLRPGQWRTLIRSYLEQPEPPTAIFSAQHYASIGCAQALHDLDLHHSIAQIGFDDIELGDVITPGITTVPQQPVELGRRAAQLLFERIADARAVFKTEILDCAIVQRGSGEIPPTRSTAP